MRFFHRRPTVRDLIYTVINAQELEMATLVDIQAKVTKLGADIAAYVAAQTPAAATAADLDALGAQVDAIDVTIPSLTPVETTADPSSDGTPA